MSAFDLKLLDSTNKDSLADLEFISGELVHLEAEKERLQKTMTLFKKELLDKERAFIANQSVKLIENIDSFLESWYEHRFKCDAVKKAVSTLRLLLFDDHEESYQTFSCIDIEESLYEHCNGLDFVFEQVREDKKPKKAFAVFIPTTVIANYKDVANGEKYGGCMLRLSVRVGYEDLQVFVPRFATFYYEEMAKEIAKIVKDVDDSSSYQALAQTVNA